MPRRYAILDVFTDRPLAGNPLAVVLDGDGLGDERMQEIAREFNLSETVFVQPPENPLHSARIRIFTPRKELPFAGHPTVGTAVLLALEGANGKSGPRESMTVLEENVGPVRCGAFVKGSAAGRAIFDLPQDSIEADWVADDETIANALRLLPGEVGFENHRPSVFSAGVAYAFVPVRDLEVVRRARPSLAVWHEAFSGDAAAALVYCRETTQPGRHFHGRMFAPTFGIDEDPATGSAIAALTGVVMKFDRPPAGSHRLTIEQGFEMGRPSLIGLEIDVEGGRIAAARIGGDAVVVARGTLTI
jgi:trans-2,3-dihydro-3-hydroxyanthranilate isomerase